MDAPPKAFISYSHDNQTHKQWVLRLGMHLREGGVDAILDQWDLGLGEDVARFMEVGIRECDRVVVVCSEEYTKKADAGKGGVGYEKQIVTAELIKDLGSNKFIPIIRGNPPKVVPSFLGYRFYLDFEDESQFETNFELLLREIHGIPLIEKPPIGPNPFKESPKAKKNIEPDNIDRKEVISKETKNNDKTEREATDLKALLKSPASVMELGDWLLPKVETARESLLSPDLVDFGQKPTDEEFRRRIAKYDEIIHPLPYLFALAGSWATHEQLNIFSKALLRIAVPLKYIGSYFDVWTAAARYPALKLFYAAGLGAISQGAYDRLFSLATSALVKDPDEKAFPIILWLNKNACLAQDFWKWLPNKERLHFPLSSFLEEGLKDTLSKLYLTDDYYVHEFDSLEIAISLIYGDIAQHGKYHGFWAPLGSYVWRRRNVISELKAELERDSNNWKPLKAGYFGGHISRAQEVIASLAEFISRVRSQMGIF